MDVWTSPTRHESMQCTFSAPRLHSGWLDAWLAGWLACWLAGWLPGWLAGWLYFQKCSILRQLKPPCRFKSTGQH